jgi:diguanylate cyclase (GGDEF)-like protein/PAS domain S-box-containing protein
MTDPTSTLRTRRSRLRALALVLGVALTATTILSLLGMAATGIAGIDLRGSLEGVISVARLEALEGQLRRDVGLVVLTMGAAIVVLSVALVASLTGMLERQRRRIDEHRHEQDELAMELRRSHERLGALIRDAADIIAVLQADGAIAYESPALERVLGYPVGSRIGHAFDEWVHPDDIGIAREAFAAVAMRPWTKGTVELRVRHRDGTWRNAETTFTNALAELAVGGIIVNYHDITEHKRLEVQLAHQALHDPLTGLANRVLFADRVAHTLSRERTDRTFAVLMLDLDDFRSINDSLGHTVGDQLLRTISERVTDAALEADTVAHMGGDEFGFLVECGTDEGRPERVASLVLAAVRAPVTIGQHVIPTRGSIGIARPKPGQTPEQLLGDADMALMLSKRRGGDRWVRSDDADSGEAFSRLSVKLDLQGALQRDELHLEYQPIVELATGRVVLAEALLRWAHPTLGLIPPATFVELAEASGAIVGIGSWAVREACVGAASLVAAGIDIAVSVNVSGRQLRDTSFVLAVTQALAYSELAADRLVLEITESVLIEDADDAIEILRRLRDRGVRVAIDDFGTGYSSLDYLRRFTVDILKIDRAFVQSAPQTSASTTNGSDGDLLAMIVDMARGLGITLIAEGIERPEELDRLRRLEAQLGQGFLFAPPMPLERLIEFVREHASEDVPEEAHDAVPSALDEGSVGIARA